MVWWTMQRMQTFRSGGDGSTREARSQCNLQRLVAKPRASGAPVGSSKGAKKQRNRANQRQAAKAGTLQKAEAVLEWEEVVVK